MKLIGLTQENVAFVDDEDYAWLSQWEWCISNAGYAVRGEREGGHNHLVLMHREIAKRMGLEVTDEVYVDHANRRRLDNRRANLRVATPTESSYNSGKINKSGYRGVSHFPYCFKGQKRYERAKQWQARIRIEGRKRALSLGYYATAEEAARAYDRAAREHHGQFATLNFPKEN